VAHRPNTQRRLPVIKQTILAAAAAGLAGLASAQSSVTLYGVADVAVAKTTGVATRMYSSTTPNNGTSRWGMRGTEDLGGGLKAGFNLEAQVGMTDGSTATAYFARASNLTLGGDWGSIKAGRTLTPSYHGVMAWELTGAANYSVVNSQFGYGGLNSRHNSEFSYTSPSWGGLSVTVGHILAADNGNAAKSDINVMYRSGPLSAGLTYNRIDNKGKNMSLGGAYNFGSVKVAGSWQDATGAGLGKGFTLGATVPMGNLSLTVDLARDTRKKDTDAIIEAKYALSQRTRLYGVVVQNGAGKAAKSVNSTVVGIRHNF
jgi:predicted porin